MFAVEPCQWITAQKSEGVRFRQLIPELFQTDGGSGIALLPQERNHFSKDRHLRLISVACRPSNNVPNNPREQPLVRHAFLHEGSQGLARIEGNVPPLLNRSG